MERCDFSSVIKIIDKYIIEESGINQVDLLNKLFESFIYEENNENSTFDNGAACRWINGQQKLSPLILKYYLEPKNRNNLSADVVNLDFVDDYNNSESKTERFRKHHRFLKKLNDDSLIIIDNFNVRTTDDELLSVVLDYSCRILFTTRSRFDDYTSYTLEELSDDSLLTLMGRLYSETENNKAVLDGIIHAVHNHTFAVELSARLLEIGILSPQALLEKLIAEKVAMNDPDKIGTKKDGKSRKATYYNHIHTLFSLYQLSEAEKTIMRNLALAPRSGILSKLMALWLELDNLNAVNDLVEKGFIEAKAGRTILLHPMIQEITVDETKPSVSNCSTLLRSIQNICLRHGEDIMYYQTLFAMIESITELIYNDDTNTLLRFLEDAVPYMEKYHYTASMRKVVDKIALLLKNKSAGTVSDRALLLDYQAILEKSNAKVIQLEKRAVNMITEINEGNAWLAANLHSNLGMYYMTEGQLKPAWQYMEKAYYILEQHDLINYHDSVALITNYAVLLTDMGRADEGLSALRKLCHVLKEATSDQSLDYGISQEAIGNICAATGDITQAEIHYKKALAIYEIHFGADNERIDSIQQQLAKLS